MGPGRDPGNLWPKSFAPKLLLAISPSPNLLLTVGRMQSPPDPV